MSIVNKYILKELNITPSKQKVSFQIKHPENCIALTGIACHVVYLGNVEGTIGLAYIGAGMLNVFSSTNRDSLYTAMPTFGDDFYYDLIDLNNTFPSEFQQINTLKFYQDVFVPIEENYLDAFYEDWIFAELENKSYQYSLRIYFRYERKTNTKEKGDSA